MKRRSFLARLGAGVAALVGLPFAPKPLRIICTEKVGRSIANAGALARMNFNAQQIAAAEAAVQASLAMKHRGGVIVHDSVLCRQTQITELT